MGKPNSTLAYTFIKVIYLDYLFSQVHFHGYKFTLLKVTFFFKHQAQTSGFVEITHYFKVVDVLI